MKIITPAKLPERMKNQEIQTTCPRCKCEFSYSYEDMNLDNPEELYCPSCGYTNLVSQEYIMNWEKFKSIERLYYDVEVRKDDVEGAK